MQEVFVKKLEKIKQFIYENKNDEILHTLDGLHAADIAEIIEALRNEERIYVFNLLEKDLKVDVITEFEDVTREKLVSGLDNITIADIIEELDSDEAVDIVQDLPEQQQAEILGTVNKETAEEVHGLMVYDEDTAGGIMSLEFIEVNENLRIKEVKQIIKQYTTIDEYENFYKVWVSDDKKVLRGYLSLHDIISANENDIIKNIMNDELKTVHPDVDQEEVANMSVKYDLISVPVIDYVGRMIGVITFDDIADVIDEEADEDISMLSGSGDLLISEESSFKISKARLPWLLTALVGELISAFVIFQFSEDLKKAVALSFFFPVIMAMGGNIGIQASAIIVRGLATGEVIGVNIKRRLIRELKAAFMNGFICGIILFTIITLWLKSVTLGITVSIALFFVVLNAAMVGTLMPFLLQRLKIDPAVSTGPFITTSNDIFGLLIYLIIVTSFI